MKRRNGLWSSSVWSCSVPPRGLNNPWWLLVAGFQCPWTPRAGKQRILIQGISSNALVSCEWTQMLHVLVKGSCLLNPPASLSLDIPWLYKSNDTEPQTWTWRLISPAGCITTPCWTDSTRTPTTPAWATTTWSPRLSSCLRTRWMFSLITWTRKETRTTTTRPEPECPTAKRTVRRSSALEKGTSSELASWNDEAATQQTKTFI